MTEAPVPPQDFTYETGSPAVSSENTRREEAAGRIVKGASTIGGFRLGVLPKFSSRYSK
jgi:hypothetical protein